MIAELLWQPFVDYGFMRRALAGCLALSAGAAPLGTILLLRRMSLVGDAMSHAILPGAALGYLLFGLSLPAMTIGGLAAGLIVAMLSGVVTRYTALREDASFAGLYLISLALGVLLISLRGSNVDLLHVLFGSVLALDDPTLYLTATIASLSMLGLALVYRPLLMECLDPGFCACRGPWAASAMHCSCCCLCSTWWGLPFAGHFDGSRPGGAARRQCALLAARRGLADGAVHRYRDGRQPAGPAAVLPRGHCGVGRHHLEPRLPVPAVALPGAAGQRAGATPAAGQRFCV